MRRFLRVVGDSYGGKLSLNPATLSWQAYFDARDITGVADNAQFAPWPDTSGHGRDANFSFQNPRYRAAGNPLASPTGEPLVDFGWRLPDGTDLGYNLAFGGVPDWTSGITSILWYMIDTLRPPDDIFGLIQWPVLHPAVTGWQQDVEFYPVGGDAFAPRIGVGFQGSPFLTGPLVLKPGTALTLGAHQSFAVARPPRGAGLGGVVESWYDGSIIASGVDWTANPDNLVHLGNGGAGGWFRGRIGFHAVTNQALQPWQLIGIYNFLRKTFG